jgi:hypothetical protein
MILILVYGNGHPASEIKRVREINSVGSMQIVYSLTYERDKVHMNSRLFEEID